MADFREMKIAHIRIGERFRKDVGDISSLAEDIKANGLMHPVVIDQDRNLIAGMRRIEAVRSLGQSNILTHRMNMVDIRKGEYSENVERKNFLPTEIDAIRQALEPEMKSEAKKRQGRGKKETPTGSTRDKVAKFAGVSGVTVDKIRKVTEAAKNDPEKFGPIAAEMDKTQNVDRAYRAVRRQERVEQQEAAAVDPGPLNRGRRYTVIYTDVPWPEEAYSKETGLDRSPEAHYQTMTIEDIKALPVGDIAHDDCLLFFWAKANRMADAIDVIRAWGFTYKTQFVWIKNSIGMGRWLRDKHEILCLATRGAPPTPPEGVLQQSTFYADKGDHSVKPERARAIIELYRPDSGKMELFAREQTPGWDVWGNEVSSPASTSAQNCDEEVKQDGADMGGAPASTVAGLEPQASEVAESGGDEPPPGEPYKRRPLPGDDLEIPEFLRRAK